MSLPYRYLLFDADDTLFDFAAIEERALTQLLEHYGLPTDGTVKGLYRSINDGLWRQLETGEITMEALFLERFVRLFRTMGITGEAAEWNHYYLTALSHCPDLLPGAEELCAALAPHYTLCLITNGVPFVQRQRLEDSPLRRYFPEERRFISGEMGTHKPEPAYFRQVLSTLSPDSLGEVLVIGDSLSSDIRGALDAGLDCVWLNRRGRPAGDVRPTYTCTDLNQVRELLLPA